MNSIVRTSIRKLILLAFFLASCQESGQTGITPTGVSTSPSFTPTTLPLPETPYPTSTHSPDGTPTLVMGEHFIDLPDWVTNPDSNVLLLPYVEDTSGLLPYTFRFVNPNNNEQVLIELSWMIYFYYWRDSSHAVFLQEGTCEEGPKYIAELNVSNGRLWQGESKEYTEPIKDCYYFLDKETNIVINQDLPETTVEVGDQTTGQTLSLTNPNDGINDVSYMLSPKKNYIAVVQKRGEYLRSGMWLPEYGNKISIFSLPGYKLLITFDENPYISSLVTFLNNETLVYIRESTPCLILLKSMEKKCIHAISEKFPNATIIVDGLLPNSLKLGFIYFYNDHGGYCLYDLQLGALDCPTDHFSSMNNQTLTNYSLSPDGKFLLFEYDLKGCPIPWCDNFEGPQWAVTDIEGTQLFELGYSDTGRYSIFRPIQPNSWRPFDE